MKLIIATNRVTGKKTVHFTQDSATMQEAKNYAQELATKWAARKIADYIDNPRPPKKRYVSESNFESNSQSLGFWSVILVMVSCVAGIIIFTSIFISIGHRNPLIGIAVGVVIIACLVGGIVGLVRRSNRSTLILFFILVLSMTSWYFIFFRGQQ